MYWYKIQLSAIYLFRPKEGNIESLQPCNLLLLRFNNIMACLFPFREFFFSQARNLAKKANNKDKTNSSDFSLSAK